MIPLHPIPKPPPDHRATFPADNLCFLAGANGLFKHCLLYTSDAADE